MTRHKPECARQLFRSSPEQQLIGVQPANLLLVRCIRDPPVAEKRCAPSAQAALSQPLSRVSPKADTGTCQPICERSRF
jgi:hypothetical protein